MYPSHTNGGDAKRSFFVAREWTVTPSRNLLAKGDQEVHIEPRVMDVLVYLAEHAGDVVSKDELMQRVWDSRTLTDDVLTVAVYALRKALGDDARRPRYVETVPRRGYRWVAPVEVEPAAPPQAKNSRRLVWPLIAASVVVLFAAAATWKLIVARPLPHVPPAEAHEADVKGRYFLDQRSPRGWERALEQFERAAALDPQDAAAQAGLADTYSAMADAGAASSTELRPRAMRAANRALELDGRSAEGHAALGRAQFLFDWDFAAAERSLRRAVALNADYMPAHQSLAWLKSARGESQEAITAARRALQLDPVNTARYTELAYVLALSGNHAEALRQIDHALQLNPRSFEAYLMKGWTLQAAGQSDSAFGAFRDGLRLSGAPEKSLEHLDAVYRTEGLPGCYRIWLNRNAGGPALSETGRAQFYVRAGELDRAIESLEHAYQKREGALAWLNVEPAFQPLRSDVRFQQIAARVGRRN